MPKTSQFIAIQMDNFDKIRYTTDTTVLLATELQSRGYSVFCYTPNNLSYQNNRLYAKGRYVRFFDDENNFYEVIKADTLDLEKATLVLIRQNPPFDMNYITNTYLLEKLQGKTLVLNDPREIRNNPEKLMIYNFPDFITPSIIGFEMEQLEEFYLNHKDVIIKPLYNFGGNEVKRITTLTEFKTILPEYIKKHEQVIVQKFLPAVFKGDKRVLIVDGEIMGALKRVPKEGQVAANLAAGGHAEQTELTVREIEVCQKVGKFLKPRNLFLAGIDLLDGYLLEINITSPTAFKTYNSLYKANIEQQVIDVLLKKIH